MLETYTYPSGFKLKYVYNQRGDMSSILGFFGTYWAGLWSGSHQNQRGQWTNYGGPSLFNTNFYDDFGYPTRTVVLNLHTKAFAQDYRYGFEPATGNLSWRTDALRGLTESFTYDDDDDGLHSRLTGFSVNGQNMAELQYQANGNISRKTDVSAAHNSYHYQHPQGKPHAVTSVSQPTPAFVSAAPEQNIVYTPFNKINTIRHDYRNRRSYDIDITYGPDNQRKYSRLVTDERVALPLVTDTYYLGQYETKRELPLTEQKIHYLSGPTGLFGILVKQGSSELLYYVLKDHLGSITGIADASGNILEDLSYDPWGRRRKANDWTDYNVTPTRFDRGYTGHEHLGQFGLINMNGRVYDPFLARFLSPDPQLQSPDYSQNYNRYSYAWNNPLKYTDPSGEFIFTALALLIPGGQAFLPLAIGADIGMWSGGSIANETANPFKWDYSSGKTWSYMAGGAFVGGLSAGAGSTVTSYVGATLSFQGGGLIAVGIGGATAGAIGGAGFNVLAGVDPFEGAWKGAVSGLAGGLVGGYISGGAGAFFGGAISGGVNAALNGRNIGRSALLGATVAWGASQLISHVNFKASGTSLTRRQFNNMSRAAQKSFTRGKEYGGWLTSDGKVEMWAKGSRAGIVPTAKPANANGFFHTHPNQGGGWIEMHSPQDMDFNNLYAKVDSYVIGRQNVYLQMPMQASLLLSTNKYYNPYPFNTYFFYPFW